MSLEELFVEVRRTDEDLRKGLVGLVGQRGEVKDAGASTRLAVLFSFVCTASELEIILPHRFVLLRERFLPVLCSVSCLGQVVAAVEVLGVDLALQQIIHLQWVSHLLTYKPCQESRAPSIPYVLVLF